MAVRCPCGLPAVIQTHPLVDGEPFPTLYWLTCIRAIRAVSRLEAAGRIGGINERIARDAEFRDAVVAAQRAYVEQRNALHDLGAAAGGVGGGPLDHVKCLHAHYAHHLASGGDPVGEIVAAEVGNVLRTPGCLQEL